MKVFLVAWDCTRCNVELCQLLLRCQLGRWMEGMERVRHTQDPSLRLKNGYAQDDAAVVVFVTDLV